MSQPENSAGTEVTMSVGSKNRWRNLFEFHALTHSCSPSHDEACSVGDVLETVMTWSVAGISCCCPSAVV